MKNTLLVHWLKSNLYTTLIYHSIFLSFYLFWLIFAVMGWLNNKYIVTKTGNQWQWTLHFKEEDASLLSGKLPWIQPRHTKPFCHSLSAQSPHKPMGVTLHHPIIDVSRNILAGIFLVFFSQKVEYSWMVSCVCLFKIIKLYDWRCIKPYL